MEAWHIIVLILHVAVAGLLLGTAFYGLIIINKATLSSGEAALAQKVVLLGKPLSGIQLLLGIILVAWEPDKFLHNPLIWSKLVLYVAAGFVAAQLVEKKLKANVGGTDAALTASIRRGFWALLIIVLTLIALGVTAAETAG